MLLRYARSSISSALAALALAAGGCGHGAPAPDAPGAAEFYRTRLDESPTGERAVEYRDALESAEFSAAKRQGTILAFRTFLSEFPDGPHQREARTLLESLRWNEASAADSETALLGFLADEPQGAHAGAAWARIAELQRKAALQSGSAEALRSWLAAHPAAAGREPVSRALEEAEFREASAAPLARRRELWRAFLVAHPDAVRRAEAEALEAQSAIDQAALLGDELELRAWARSGSSEARTKLAQLSLEQAAARLDRTDLDDLSRGTGSEAARAREILARLQRLGARAKPLSAAAQALYLPRPSIDPGDLPQAPHERGRALRQAALALDGRALPVLLAELSSPQSWVAESALASWWLLYRSLPPGEAQLRSARSAASLEPIAQDGPHLAALALALFAAGDPKAALEKARAGAARDPRSLVSQRVAAELEAGQGERSLSRVSARALLAALREELEARSAPPAPDAPAPVEEEEAPKLWSLCALVDGAHEAQAMLQASGGADPAALEDARALSASIDRAVAQEERAARQEGACQLERDFLAREAERQGKARAQQAAQLLGAKDLAAEALDRARARDPSPAVRALLSVPAWPEPPGVTPPAAGAATIAP